MKYISIDIETTGLNPNTCQLLSLGAIIEDTENILPYEECPKFYAIITTDKISGEPFALNMNKDIIEAISRHRNAKGITEKLGIIEEYEARFLNEDVLLYDLNDFLIENGFTKRPKLVAGANFEFDKSFLSRLPYYKELNIGRRVLEPSHYTVDWKNDSILPSLFQCKERLGLEGGVAHNALADAWDVIQCLRTQYT